MAVLDTVRAINGVPIRLTDERWYDHIVTQRPYMSSYYDAVLDTVEDPEYILPGYRGAKIAIAVLGKRTILHVVYVEVSRSDGFINSAYVKPTFNKKSAIWRRDDQD